MLLLLSVGQLSKAQSRPVCVDGHVQECVLALHLLFTTEDSEHELGHPLSHF